MAPRITTFSADDEQTNRIHHIPRILYHWRRSATSTSDNIRRKPEALEAARRAIDEHLRACGEPGHVAIDWRTHGLLGEATRSLRRKEGLHHHPDARPHRSARALHRQHRKKTSYRTTKSWSSTTTANRRKRASILRALPHRLLHYSGPFNYSAINNFAVEQTDAPWLLFLNNDVEVIESEWLTAMVEHVQRPEVGAVGARLLYP